MPQDAAVSNLLLEWEERAAQGRPITPEELCASCPELLEELRRCVDLLRAVAPLFDLDNASTDGVPPSIPGFEILARLGSGGMGVVYRARDTTLDRIVAIKMPKLGVLTSRIARARFERESRVLAQLRHPNIVPVHAAGLADGHPYFVMDYVARGSLEEQARTKEFAAQPKRAAHLVERVARAVDYAHQHGILHRDLKPSNILLDDNDQPLVCDFGLATLLDADPERTEDTPSEHPDVVKTNQTCSRLTSTGVAIGTPAYMAPEQFDPSLGSVGPQTDVWALGVILYEILTDRKPFHGETREELRTQVCDGIPPRPRNLRPGIDRRLEIIVLRCLEKKASRRFPSAAALAHELARCQRPPMRWPRWVALAIVVLIGLGIWRASHPSPEEKVELTTEERYEERVAPLLAQLQGGEAVALIESGGTAPAFMVRCGEGITKARMTADGFTVTTPGLGLVEILPRVPISHYRVHAELRHDRSRFGPVGDGGVGVTFTGRHAPSPHGGQHVVAAVALNDWDQRSRSGKLQSRAMMQLVWYLDTPTDGQSPFKHRICYPPNETLWYPSPTGPDGALHTLDIDVKPEGYTAVLGDSPGQTMGPLQPNHFLTFSKILRTKEIKTRDAELDPLKHQAIGVLVSGGQCTIRELRIVPQPQATQ
jgi:hypothetical protein